MPTTIQPTPPVDPLDLDLLGIGPEPGSAEHLEVHIDGKSEGDGTLSKEQLKTLAQAIYNHYLDVQQSDGPDHSHIPAQPEVASESGVSNPHAEHGFPWIRVIP